MAYSKQHGVADESGLGCDDLQLLQQKSRKENSGAYMCIRSFKEASMRISNGEIEKRLLRITIGKG